MKALPIQMQIEVLESARTSLIKYHAMPRYFGLCFHIEKAIMEHPNCPSELINGCYYKLLEFYIPLFKKQNAYKFKAVQTESTYWWRDSQLKLRLEFLDWMINELKQQL